MYIGIVYSVYSYTRASIVSWTTTEKSVVPFPMCSIDIDYLIFIS